MSINHLNIEQDTSSIEVVSSSVIDKLYELALNPSLDVSSNILGNLQATHAYQDAVDYLLNKFPGLQINVTGGAYIRFADSAVASICATNWGDGTGITKVQASVITNFNETFTNNNSIIAFSELKLFFNINGESGLNFNSCINLKSIDLSIFTKIGKVGNYYPYTFYGCVNLDTVVFNQNLQSIGTYVFNGCTKFNTKLPTSLQLLGGSALNGTSYSFDVDLPNLRDCTENDTNVPNDITSFLMDGWFSGTKIVKVINLGSITRISRNSDNYFNGCFERCFNLKYVTLPATLQTIGCRTFYGDSALIYIRCLATTPPTIQSSLWLASTNSTFKFYVPDDSVTAYKAATNWSSYASRIFSLTQFAIDFPNG